MSSKDIEINFNVEQIQFLTGVFSEVFGGGSTDAIQTILGDQVNAAAELDGAIEYQTDAFANSIQLSESQWRTLYHVINAVIYGLGPSELETCRNLNLQQAADVNVKICSAVWGAFGGASWTEPN